MAKVDPKKTLKHPYAPSTKEVAMVDVPPMNFLMIDGEGDPGGSESYTNAVEALYAVSYALKFMVKKEAAVDYAVMPPACGGRTKRRRSTSRTGTRGSGRR